MNTCTTTNRCTCPLLGSVTPTHVDDDVVQVVHASLLQTQEEERLARQDAVRWLLKQGLACWGVPARQAHRADEWREAVRCELLAQLDGSWGPCDRCGQSDALRVEHDGMGFCPACCGDAGES